MFVIDCLHIQYTWLSLVLEWVWLTVYIYNTLGCNQCLNVCDWLFTYKIHVVVISVWMFVIDCLHIQYTWLSLVLECVRLTVYIYNTLGCNQCLNVCDWLFTYTIHLVVISAWMCAIDCLHIQYTWLSSVLECVCLTVYIYNTRIYKLYVICSIQSS